MRIIASTILVFCAASANAQTSFDFVNDAINHAKSQWKAGQAALEASSTWKAVQTRSPGALKKLEAIAQGGDPDALNMMGWLYDNGAYGVTANPKNAAQYFKTAASRGNEVAIYNIGVLSYYGRGLPKDEAVAYNWFARAAQSKTITRACVRAAVLGVTRKVDSSDIDNFIECATNRNNPTAFFLRGRREYQTGEYEAAASWLTKAANAMEPNAPWLMSRLYSQSPGLAPDRVLAAAWWAIGARLNPRRPGINATGLNSFGLTDDERQRANHFAEQWISTHKSVVQVNYAKTIVDVHD